MGTRAGVRPCMTALHLLQPSRCAVHEVVAGQQESLATYKKPATWAGLLAIKRTWWMPWQLEAMKDVVGYEKLRGAVKQALIRRCPNGETHLIYQVSHTEYIGM